MKPSNNWNCLSVNLPNLITLFRIILAPFIFTAIIYYEPARENLRWIAITLFAIASITDALDGLIVRRWNLKSNLGTFLDPVADKLLLISTFLAIHFSQLALKPPIWIIVLVIFRDIIIVGGLIVVFLTVRRIVIRPNILGKATTFFQMVTILLTLFQSTFAPPIWHLTALLTAASCFVYMSREMRRIHEPRARRPSTRK